MSTTEQQTEVRAAIETATRQLTDAFGQRDAAGCARPLHRQGAMLRPTPISHGDGKRSKRSWKGLLTRG